MRVRGRLEGPSEERTGPIVFKDLNRQCGHEGQQTVCDMSQDQLFVSITTNANMGGASLEDR